MGRGLSRAASLIEGFNGMYDAIGRVQRDREIARIASETPTMDEGFTPAQGAEIQAAANSGQYDITWDPEAKGYRVTAKTDPNSSGVVKAAPRQTFLGQVQDTPLDERGISRARQMAMAGVLERTGDIEGGARMRDRVSAEDDREFNRQRARKMDARDDERWRRDQENYDAEKAYREGMGAVIEGSTFGQRSKAFQSQMADYEKAKKAYDEKVAAGDGSAIAPTMPQQPTMTSGEKLLDAASVIAFKAKHGKASPEEIMKVSEQMQALGQENYLQMLRMAQSGAPLTAVVQAFNSTGKAQIDPAAIVKDERVKRPGGVESRLITYKLPDGRTQTIDTYAEMSALGKADDLLNAAQQEHQQRMAEGQLKVAQGNLAVHQSDAARLAAEFAAGAGEREAKASVAKLRKELAETEDPERQKVLEGKIRALSTGTRGGAAGGADPAKVKEAQTVLASGLAADMPSALELVMQQPDKIHADFVRAALQANGGANADGAVKTADKVMQSMGWRRNGNRWTKVAAQGGAPASAPPAKGTVVDGYEFMGGDPNNQANWRKK